MDGEFEPEEIKNGGQEFFSFLLIEFIDKRNVTPGSIG
jgi:hypothetical protein